MTLQFYMTPGSCSTGIHILLEELELPFQVTVLNLPPACAAHLQRMRARPVVRQVLMEEGYHR